MEKFDAACIKANEEDVIIVLLEPSFGLKSLEDKDFFIFKLQALAINAQLAGIVVPVWDAGNSIMGIHAPTRLQNFFNGIDLSFVKSHINSSIPRSAR